jgi:hypothetical protein
MVGIVPGDAIGVEIGIGGESGLATVGRRISGAFGLVIGILGMLIGDAIGVFIEIGGVIGLTSVGRRNGGVFGVAIGTVGTRIIGKEMDETIGVLIGAESGRRIGGIF